MKMNYYTKYLIVFHNISFYFFFFFLLDGAFCNSTTSQNVINNGIKSHKSQPFKRFVEARFFFFCLSFFFCISPGRLGQLGMKQMLSKSVQNVAKAINLFGKHGITEGTGLLLIKNNSNSKLKIF